VENVAWDGAIFIDRVAVDLRLNHHERKEPAGKKHRAHRSSLWPQRRGVSHAKGLRTTTCPTKKARPKGAGLKSVSLVNNVIAELALARRRRHPATLARVGRFHVIDIVPTLYEVIGITPPDSLNGVTQKPIEGVSFAYTFGDANAKEKHTTQYFELLVNRGLYHDGWMASAISFAPWQPVRTGFDPDKQKWELYHVAEDFSQAEDLADQNPQKLRELQDLWWAEAAKYNVLPLDWRGVERLNAEAMGRPDLAGNRKSFTFYPRQLALPNDAAPRILNKSWTLTADVEIPESGAEGMIVTHGGLVGGYGLYIRDGKPSLSITICRRTAIPSRARTRFPPVRCRSRSISNIRASPAKWVSRRQ
jgi:hypothetical protein